VRGEALLEVLNRGDRFDVVFELTLEVSESLVDVLGID
jgi:hypothetical protein